MFTMAGLLIQVLAAFRAKPLAAVAAQRSQRHRQEHLLPQNIFQQQTIALIVAYLGFCLGNGNFVCPAVGAQRAVQQIKVAGEVMSDGLKASRARYFYPCREIPNKADVRDDLPFSVVFLDQLCPARRGQDGDLMHPASKINGTGLERFPEVKLPEFQFLQTDKHIAHRTSPRERRTVEDTPRRELSP